MLTSFQASPIAYWPLEGEQYDGPVCAECADREAQGRTAHDAGQDVDEMFIHYYGTPAGFQPASRYAMEDAFPDGADCVRCGATIVESEDVAEADPNPPVPRWVPCSICRAGDGEPCDLAVHDLRRVVDELAARTVETLDEDRSNRPTHEHQMVAGSDRCPICGERW